MNIENLGTGVDIESIERFKKYSKESNNPFLKKAYTQKELDYCFSKENYFAHLAGR